MADIYTSVFICFLMWELLNCGTGPKLFATPLDSPRGLFLPVGDSECAQGCSSDLSGLFPVAGQAPSLPQPTHLTCWAF